MCMSWGLESGITVAIRVQGLGCRNSGGFVKRVPYGMGCFRVGLHALWVTMKAL